MEQGHGRTLSEGDTYILSNWILGFLHVDGVFAPNTTRYQIDVATKRK